MRRASLHVTPLPVSGQRRSHGTRHTNTARALQSANTHVSRSWGTARLPAAEEMAGDPRPAACVSRQGETVVRDGSKKRGHDVDRGPLCILVEKRRLELPTPALRRRCSPS